MAASEGDASETALATESSTFISMPMRDRLLGPLLAAASPCHKNKLPLQLPPPPPGMPACQVEKWRKEVAKIISKQQKEEMKLLRQREKEEERIRRQEEIMRAKVDKLARKMQQETASLRASHPTIPLTQQFSPDASPRGSNDYDGTYLPGGEITSQDKVEELQSVESVNIGDNNKENRAMANRMSMSPNHSVNAADEVSKVLAARRLRVEQAMQESENRKEELAKATMDRKQRELASEMERKELQSFEQQIPNKQRLQDEEHERVIEAAAQRAAKEAQVKSNLDTNMLTEFEAKRKSLSHPRRKSSESLKLENVRSPQEANKSLDLDASDMDYVIDEIPEEICSPEKETGSAADTLCGIGVMLSQNAAGLYVVVEISSSGSAAKSGLLQIGDEIESIDGQSVSRLNSSSVGEMIRGRSGTQVVLDVFSGKGKLRTRVGITRAPLEQQPEVSTPINHLKMAVTSYTAMTSPQQPASTTHLNACAEPVLPNPPVDSKNNANNCGVGMAFEFNPAGGLLVLRKIADGIQSPFAVGDCLTQINGTSVTSNAMLAPSLIWGEAGSTVKIKMVRNGDVPQFIEARLVRKPTVMDANLIMSGGGKTCGIGVVLEVEARSRCFYVKRVIHGGPAFSAGVSQGDLVTHIDNKDLRLYTKDQLPGLILGPEGSMLTLQLMRAGESNARQLVITRFLDTAKAQQSNLAATALLNFDCMETINRQLDGVDFSSALQVEIVTALRTVSKRVQIANVSFKDGSASVIILPDFEGGDTRSVEELVRDLVYESSNQRSTLRKNHVCGSLSKITILGHVDLQTSPRNVLREDASQASNDTQNAMPSERGGINSIPLQLPSVNKPPPMDSDDVSSTLLPLRQCLSPRVLNVEKAAQPAKVPFMESRRLSPQGQSSDNGKGLHALQTGGNSIALSAEHVEAEQTLEKKTIGAEQDDGRVQMPVPSSETLAEKSDARDDLLIAKMPAACNGDQLVADESAKNARMAPGHSQFVACSDGQDQNAESFPIIDDKITMGVVDKHVSSSVVNTNLNNGIPSEMMSSRSKTVDALAEKADVNGGDKIVIDVVQQQVSNAVALSAMPKDIPSESCVVSEPLTVAPALATSAPKGEDVVMLEESTSRSLDAAVKQLSESVKTPVHQAGMATKTFPVLPAPQFISASGSALEIIDALDPSILGSPNDPSEDPWEDCTPLRHFNSEALCESEEELAIRENLQALQAMGVFDRDDQAPNRTSSSTTCPKGGNAPCTANPAPTQASAEESRGVPPAESDRKDAAPLHILKAISAQQTAVSAVTAVRLNIAPEEVKGLQEKFPHRIPVVLSKAEFSIAPEMQGNKYLVPLNITTRNFYSLVTKRIEGVPAGMHLVFSVAGTPILDNGSIQNLWETHQNCDGILHVTYDVVEGEISLSQDVDEPLDQASLVTCPAEQLTLPANLTTEPGIGAADALADQLKNWVTLDSFKPPVVEQGGCEESLAPPSLFNALGNNLLQMVMPSPQAQAQTQMKPSDSNKLHSVKTSETSLVQPSQPQQQKEHLAGIGLKIERDVNGKGFRIVGVAPDGPSANTVMKLNDYLIAIDGRDISDMRTAAVAGLLKGPEGSTVQLTLRMPRGGGQATHKITLTRATVARHGPDADRADEGEEKTVAPSPAKNGDKLNIFGFSF